MKLLILFVLFSLNSIAQNQLEFKKDLEVLDSSLNFNGDSGYKMITVIGNINNISDRDYQNLVIEIKFYDTNKKMIDTVTSELYGNVFPAQDNAAFRIQGGASKKEDNYISHQVRILSADIKKPCKSESGLRKFLSDWGGFIIFLSFMTFLIYSSVKYQKEEKKSKQKFMDAADSQSKQFEKMTQLLENIAQKKEK